MPPLQIDPLIALAVVLATGATDAIYVMFTNSVLKRRRLPAATWSSIWYLLSSFAVIKYTNDWTYVFFAAFGSFVGAYLTLTFLRPAGSIAEVLRSAAKRSHVLARFSNTIAASVVLAAAASRMQVWAWSLHSLGSPGIAQDTMLPGRP